MKAKKCWVLAISIGLLIVASPWVVVGAETKSEIGNVEVLQTKIRELEQTIETQEKVITELKATCGELKEELKLQITENSKLRAFNENRQKETSAEPALKKARWANTDSWRHLSIGADETTVRRLLGEPKYIQCGSDSSIWYYQSVPDNVSDLLTSHTRGEKRGYVYFDSPNTSGLPHSSLPPFTLKKPKFTVYQWAEPIWESLDTNSTYETKTGEKSTLKRHRAKWEDSSNWRKLQVNMGENEVRSLLGEPREVSIGGPSGATVAGSHNVWRYTLGFEGLGELTFTREGSLGADHRVKDYTNVLESWKEPFWPSVERDLQQKEK
jgi:regulator of replication initiation timing